MPINSQHPSFRARWEEMRDCRTAFEGSRAVKLAGVRYLPRLKAQTDEDYKAYKDRAVFFGITSKTVSALVGMAMMRNPILKYSERMAPYFTDLQGAQFLEMCSSTIAEILLMGGYGYLIDAPPRGSLLPNLSRYSREHIINWDFDDDTGQLSMVMLEENVTRRTPADRYVQEIVTQYRELKMLNGRYTVTVYDENMEERSTIVPTVKGQPLTFIPFYLINPFGVSMDVVKSPVLDIVELNFSHYRSSADLEHGRHFTGLPTPVITGMEAAGDIYIGSERALVLPDPNARASFMEFLGQGLSSLETALTEKQGQMASMSARLIDNSKRGSEAAETVKLRYMSESASLITIVRAVEGGLALIFRTVAQFMDEEPPEIELNKEFLDSKMTPAELTALVKAYIEGTISEETFINNLRRGDLISSHQDSESEKRYMEELRAQKEEREREASRNKIGQGATA